LGDCTTDAFSITSASGGTPVICGFNTGQHSEKIYIKKILPLAGNKSILSL